jgi:hypothetical protein
MLDHAFGVVEQHENHRLEVVQEPVVELPEAARALVLLVHRLEYRVHALEGRTVGYVEVEESQK